MNDLDLVDLIYSAAGDPQNGWPAFIQAFNARYPEAKTVLGTYQSGTIRLSQSATDIGLPDMHAYETYFGSINPVVPPLLEAKSTSYFDADDFIEPDAFLKTEVYNDFWRPMGDLRRNVGVVLENNGPLFSTFCTHYPVNRYDEHCADSPGAVIHRLMPHLRRALRLQAQLEAAAQTSASLLGVLDKSGQAVFILSETGWVQNMNTSASLLLEDNGLFWIAPGQRLQLRNTKDDDWFQARRRAAARLETIASPLDRASDAVRAAGGEIYRIEVEPALDSLEPRHRFSVALDRRVIVRVQRIGSQKRLDDQLLQLSFGLTPAEISLVAGLCDGLTLKAFADTKDVSLHTVRNQLSSVFGKTGTHRQAELVTLLSKYFE